MLFREVLPEVERALSSQAWLGPGHAVTIVRDLRGCIRILIESPRAGEQGDPEGAARQRLAGELKGRLDDWLGDHTPVWQAPAGPEAFVDLVRAERRPHPTPGSGDWSCFLLERHAARHGWVGDLPWAPPWTADEVEGGSKPPIVVFFSHKGGVGRTTALAAVAMHLSRWGIRVLAVDLDLEAPGLGPMLISVGDGDPGLLDVMVGPERKDIPPTLARPVTDATLVGGGPPIHVVPAGVIDETYVQMLARLDLQGARDAGQASRRLGVILGELSDRNDVGAILVDARAGFHDVGGIALGALCHGAVFFGLPSEQSFHGLGILARVLGAAGRDDDGDPRIWLQVVHALGPSAAGEDERKRFRERAWDRLAAGYYDSDAPPAAGLGLQPHDPVVLPFLHELRGLGDTIDFATAEILLREPFRDLSERLARAFGLPVG